MRGSRSLIAALVIASLASVVFAPIAVAVPAREMRQGASSTTLSGLSTVAPLSVDDQIPGVPLDSFPVTSHTIIDTIDAYPTTAPPVDPVDVYSVYLAPGDQISLSLTGTGVNFDLFVFSPASLTVQSAEYVFSSDGPTATERICYTASDRFGPGRYYVAVSTFDSEGSYTLDWQVSGRSDGNVPGNALRTRSVAGTVDPLTDADDVFNLWLPEGQSVTCTLTAGDPGDEFELWVFPPRWNNGGILEPTLDIYHSAEGVHKKGASVVITLTVGPGRGGSHYIDVSTDGASGPYTLEWAVGVDIPGKPLESAVTTGVLPAVSVWSRPLRWGQTFHGSLYVTPTAPAPEIRLWKPGTFSITGDPANVVAEDDLAIVYEVPDEASEGTYYLEVNGVGSPLFELRANVVTESRRLSGADRYATAVQVSQSTFGEGSNTVVIASGEGFADAVSASSLAGAYDAPLLLVRRTTLPSTVAAEIDRLGATQAFIVGGEAAISAAVASAIDARPAMETPVRVSGSDRYATSAEVTRRVISRLGAEWDGGVFVARGDAFPDALAVGPLAWQSRRPVVLTQPQTLPAATSVLLAEIDPVSAVIVGGTVAVNAPVATVIDGLVGTVERVEGATRFATAANVAAYGVEEGIVRADYIGVATGTTFPDALTGGVACGAEGGVLLLTWPGSLAAEVHTFIDDYCDQPTMDACRVFGGAKAVSDPVMGELDEALMYRWITDPPAWFLDLPTPERV
ncbi:MAG: cell wall-binding repeat-containing protein [Coriobacteriia bacterium]